MVKPIFKLLAVFLIIFGLVLSFVYPILAIAGLNTIIELPPVSQIPGGPEIPAVEGDWLWQEFNIGTNATVTNIYLGLAKSTDEWDSKSITIQIEPKDRFIDDYVLGCLEISISNIPDTSTFNLGHWSQVQERPGTCSEYGGSVQANAEYPIVANRTYIMSIYSGNARPGVYWQASEVQMNNWDSSHNTFSFRLAGVIEGGVTDDEIDGNGDGVDVGPPPILPPKDPSPNIQQVSENPTIYFLGPLIFALGIGLLAHSMGWIDNKIILLLLIILAFVLMFYLSNYALGPQPCPGGYCT